jgi:hypothetical protein
VDFIKIDVEGAELSVLAGMKRALESCARLAMIVELNPTAQRAAGHEPSDLVEALLANGFSIYEMRMDGLTLMNRSFPQDHLNNMLCLKGGI